MTSLNVPVDLPISLYLLKQCKLWVWDFDDTLIDTKTYFKKHMEPESILKRTDDELTKDIPQWKYFRRLVEYLVMNGRYVGIASFGTYEIIQAYMQRIMGFNQHYFTKSNIVAPCYSARTSFRFNLPPNKNEYIYSLMRVYRVQDFKRVVLFDDKPSNIADAIAIGIIAIQIATLANGDNPNSNNIFFGPWVMSEFDKQINTLCGSGYKQKHQSSDNNDNTDNTDNTDNNNNNNKKKQHKSEDILIEYSNLPVEDIDFGTGIRAKNNYFQEPYVLGISNKQLYNNRPQQAFGTGIGNRKILTKPSYKWNAYKTSAINIPQWQNGNYVNVPNLVKTDGYWDKESSTCATTSSLLSETSATTDTDTDTTEHFTNNDYSNSSGCNCKPYNIKWVILLIIIILLICIGIVRI